jgi:hypothetical protein
MEQDKELTLTEIAGGMGEEANGGLVLKRDQGFQFLDPIEKAFMLCFLYEEPEKRKAYAKVIGMDWDSLSANKKNHFTIKSNAVWKKIENHMGGVRNIITLMGVDIVDITRHAQRLLGSKRLQLDKSGSEHWSDDGSTQIKALEFLAKLSGNYSEDIDATHKTSININFGGSRPANPRDIESDNMEVVIGGSSSAYEED